MVIGISRHIEFDLRNDLFEHLLRLPVPFFQRRPTGDLMSRATNDLAAVRMMLGPGFMNLVNTIVRAMIAVGFMLAISPRITLYALLPLPCVSLTAWLYGDRIHRRFEEIQAQFSAMSAHVQENLAGVRVVRAFANENAETRAFERLNQDYLDRNLKLIRTSGLFYPTLAFLSGLAALLGLYLGGREVIGGRITLGQFVAFTIYLGMLNWPMLALGWVINLFQRGRASFDRIVELLDATPEIESAPAAIVPATCRGELEFRELVFTYPGATEPALRGVSFRVPAGETVALVGHTGSGKSTLLAMIPRVQDPPAGTVFLDGVDVRELDLAWLRQQVAFATQDPLLFSETVADNIAYGVRARRAPTSSASSRWRGSTATSRASRTATTRWSASAASRCRAGSASAPASRARCCSAARSCCSTTACRASTPTPRRDPCALCASTRVDARRSSCRTA
jgi:ATP-binding cassette subfamily B protein